jgi:hypothetical protein
LKQENDFEQAGNSILTRMHRMGRKMDLLEQSIGDLMHDAGLDGHKDNGLSLSSSEEEEEKKDFATTATSSSESPPKLPSKLQGK